MATATDNPVKVTTIVNVPKPEPGERRDIPKNDPAKVKEMLDVAKTYFDARLYKEQPIFIYGHTTAVDEDFFALKVRNQIDCSAYIGLVLRGIHFKDSPYAYLIPENGIKDDLMGKDLIRDINNKLKPNTKYVWAFDPFSLRYRKKLSDTTRYPTRTASQMGEMYVEMGRSLDFKKDFSNVEPGDIIFYSKLDKRTGGFKQPNRYKKISHISVVVSKEPASTDKEVADKGYPYNHMMLEVSSRDEVVLNRSLEKIVPETVCMIARPDLSGETTKNLDYNSMMTKFVFGKLGKIIGKKG